MDFNSEINRILNETYFGGSPYTRRTGIQRHVQFEDAEADAYTEDEIAAMLSLADKAAKFQSKVETEKIADRGKTLIGYLNSARDLYRSAAGPNQLGKIQAGVNRSAADPLSLYIIELEYGNIGFEVDILDRILDRVLPKFLNKTGKFSKDTDEESIIDTAAETVEVFRNKMANFDFKKANVEVERYHYDTDQSAYKYVFCGDCEGEGVKPRRIREADPVKGIEAVYAKGYGWDHNGFRIEAYSPRDLGSMANLYDNMAAFNVVTLVGPHTNPSQDSARIATIHIQ